jgi:hypothetical protein
MTINRFIAWTGRVGMSLAVLAAGLLVVATERPRARAAASEREPAPVQQESKANDGPVRAYDQPATKSAKFHTVTLTILDDETSRPLADVELRIHNHVDRTTHLFQTDSNGRFRFEYPILRDDPKLTIDVRKDGYVPLQSGWGTDDWPKPSDALTLRLRRGTMIGGIVVGVGDRPVEGVTVLVSVRHFGPGKRTPNPAGFEPFWEVPARTGPDGRWHIDGVPHDADAMTQRLWHPDYVSDWTLRDTRSPKTEALRNQSDRQVLLRGLRLEGRVVDEQGRPIPGAGIDGFDSNLNYLGKASNPADAKGRFHIHLARGTKLYLTAFARGYAATRYEVVADPDRPFVELRLPEGKRLRVRVVDPAGHPIEGASVISGLIVDRSHFDGRTDEQGRFHWDCAPPTLVSLRIEADGFVSENVWLMAGEDESVITLRPAVALRLDAVDAQTGAAIPRFRVRIGTLEPGTNSIHWGVRTGRNAPHRFEAELDAEKGPYHIEIGADGYEPATIVFARERKTLRTSIKLEKAANGPRRE